MRARTATVALLATATLVAGCGDEDPAVPAGGSTLRATYADPDGNGVLERAGGEALVDRPARGPKPGRELARLAVLTDTHLRDEESPARPSVLDRAGGSFSSTFRPQEALSAQVFDAAIRAVNAQHPRQALVLGDLIDNAQANELALATSTLRGGRVDPDSGARGYDGVQRAVNPDPLFYRPDVDAPRHPGLVTAAQRSFTTAGLRAPWFPAVGNHDLQVQGEVIPTARTSALATGDRRLVAPGKRLRRLVRDADRNGPRPIDRVLDGGLPGRTAPVAPDPQRREPAPAQTVAGLRAAANVGGTGPVLDYAFDAGPRVRVLVLDTTRRESRSGGALRPAQVAWLRDQLRAAGERWVLVASHHRLDAIPEAAPALRLLDADSHVLAMLHGDSHRNRIRHRGRAWVIGTSSLADWPQQARMLRVAETPDGGAVLETWMVDTTDGPHGLAGTARELAFLDAQGGRPQHFAGARTDRNARLYAPAP